MAGVQPGFELSHGFIEIAGAKKDDTEVDIVAASGGSNAIARCRLNRASCKLPISRKAVPRKAWLAPAAGSSRTLSRNSAYGLLFRAAVPQRDPKIVVSVSKFGPESDGALQLNQAGRQITLLAQHETQQVMCFGMSFVRAKASAELLLRGVSGLLATPSPGRA